MCSPENLGANVRIAIDAVVAILIIATACVWCGIYSTRHDSSKFTNSYSEQKLHAGVGVAPINGGRTTDIGGPATWKMRGSL
jgi:hypothetical protein